MTETKTTTTIMKVSPKQAAEWLAATNLKNRRLNQKIVANYAQSMRRGSWKLNGESIKFDPQGNLIDGQHRLHAVVQSGVTIETAVARNVPTDFIHTIDQGRARSFSDTLSIKGESNTAGLAAAAKAIYEYELKGSPATKVEHDLLLDVIQRHPDLRQAVMPGKQLAKSIGLRPAPAIAAVYLTRKADLTLAEEFEESLRSGAGLGIDDPRLALRKYAHNLVRFKNSNGVNAAREQIAAYIRAWNAWLEGRPMQTIRLGKNDYYPAVLGGQEQAS